MDQFIRDYTNTNIKTQIINNIEQFKKYTETKNQQCFSILHQNIRSISKNFDEIKIFLSQFNTFFDIIILTETWHIVDTNCFHINGYEMIYNHGNINQNDGVVMYIRSKYNHNTTLHYLSNIQVIKTKLTHLGKPITITAIYRPPSTCPEVFNNELRAYLALLADTSMDEYKFIVGDINIDILSDSEDVSHEYLNILAEAGYESLINDYTRVDKESKSCIDHMFVKSKRNVNSYTPIILQNNITDHYTTINLIENIDTTAEPLPPNRRTSIKRVNQKELKLKLQTTNFENELADMGAEQAANFLVNKIKTAVAEATTVIRIKPNEIKRKDWITAGLVRATNNKHKLFIEWKKDVDNVQAKNKYLTYRNTLNTLIKTTKNKFFQDKINKNAGSMNLWKTANEITGNIKKNNIEIKQLNTTSGTQVYTDKGIADVLNQHYTNVGKSLANKIVKSHKTVQYNKKPNPNTIFLYSTSVPEVKKFMGELKSNKAPGIDCITSEIIKQNMDTLAPALTIIINKIFETSICPKVFKMAIVKPLYKSGDKNLPENYRPISLISNLAKIFEKILKVRLVKFFDKFDIISPSQYGFQENKSTQDALIHLTDEIHNALDASSRSLCVFIDLAKAFDTVNHHQLLECLNNVGIRGNANDLIKNYLKDRPQFVKIRNTLSDESTVEYGVPQGTVLGPILFTVYINDLFYLPSKGKIIAFADDTAIFYTDTTWDNLKKKVEKDLELIKSWFDCKLLTVNVSKTKYMTFTCHNYNLPTFDNILLQTSNGNSLVIEPTTSIKYLGVTIDTYLKWDIHIEILIKKLRGILFRFKLLKQVLDIKNLRIMYHGLVQSLLEYGIIAWGSVKSTYLKKLEVIQKRFLKLMFNKKCTYPTDLLYEEAKICSLSQLYFKNLALSQYKYKDKLKMAEHQYITRSRTNEVKEITRAKKKIGQKTFTGLGPRIYNMIPMEIRKSRNLKEFKIKLNRWITGKNNEYFSNIINRYV